MVEKLKTSVSVTTCVDKIIYCISKCAMKYTTPESLHAAQFDSDGIFYEELLNLWTKIKDSPVKSIVYFSDEIKGGDSKRENGFELDFKFEISKIFEECPNLVIIIDEAIGLLANNDDIDKVHSPIRTVYRKFNEGPDGLVGLFLSTSSSMKSLVPNHIGSGGPNNKKDLPPITDFRFFDLFTIDPEQKLIEEELKLY